MIKASVEGYTKPKHSTSNEFQDYPEKLKAGEGKVDLVPPILSLLTLNVCRAIIRCAC